jgi:hypothetical protein
MDRISSLLKRPKLYNNIDGVGELGIGFMMLSWGLLRWLQAHSPEGSAWHEMWAFAIYVVAMVSILHYGTKAIKRRITYPRTGFVEYRKWDMVWPAIAAALFVPLMAVGAAIVHRRHWNMPPFFSLYGLFLAAGYGYGLARTVRWKWVIATAMASGAVAVGESFTALFVMFGALFSISGAITFGLYLRQTREAQ